MNEQNVNEMKRFMDLKKINGQSPWTIQNQEIVLKQLDEYLGGKTFKDATEQDIMGFINTRKGRKGEALPGTKKNAKIVVKGFYRFLYDLKRGEYPSQVDKLNGGNGKRELPIRPEDIINDEDIAKMVKCCTNYRDEALVVTLYESGCRLREFLGMDIGHLTFDERGIVLAVKGKTGERRIRLIRSVPYLTKWLENHPERERKDAPLWCSIKKYKRENTRITDPTLQYILKELGERSHIGKPVNPHAFRHSRISQLAKIMTDAKLRVFAGWTAGSDMAGTYVHLAGEDLDQDIMKDAGIEQVKAEPVKTILSEKECSRCHAMNAGTNEFCATCGKPFDEALMVSKDIGEEAILREELHNIKKDYDRLTKMMIRMVKEMKVLKAKAT